MFNESLAAMLKVAREAADGIDTIPTVDEFIAANKEPGFGDGLKEILAALAITDLHVFLKQLFQFANSDQPFNDDLKGDIKAAVNYLTDNFGNTVEKLEYLSANTVGFKLNQEGEYFSIKPFLDNILNNIIQKSKIIISFNQKV